MAADPGKPCSLTGAIQLDADNRLFLQEPSGPEWLIRWTAVPVREGVFSVGGAATIVGTCDAAASPPAVWVQRITAGGGGAAAPSQSAPKPAAAPSTTPAPTPSPTPTPNPALTPKPAPAPGTAPAAPAAAAARAPAAKRKSLKRRHRGTAAPKPTPGPAAGPVPVPGSATTRTGAAISRPPPLRQQPPPPPPLQQQPPPPPPPPPREPSYVITSLVMQLDICGSANMIDIANVQAAWSNTLSAYFPAASFGAVQFPASVSYNRVLPSRIPLGCSGTTAADFAWASRGSCDDNLRLGWAEAADKYAAEVYGIDVSRYRHRVYLLPPDTACAQVDTLAVVNCNGDKSGPLRIWWNQGFGGGVDDAMLMAHELGHNLGLYHSEAIAPNGDDIPYGDPTCPMGGAVVPIMFNAPQSTLLGWTAPQAVLTAEELPQGVWTPFALSAHGSGPTAGLLLRPTTWGGGGAWGWGEADALHVSLRARGPNPAGPDAALPAGLAGQVHVHKSSGGCAPTFLLSRLSADPAQQAAQGLGARWPLRGSTVFYDGAAPGIVVELRGVDEAAGTARVAICRVQSAREAGAQCGDGLDNDCDGQVDNC